MTDHHQNQSHHQNRNVAPARINQGGVGASKVTTVVATTGTDGESMTEISYVDSKVVGNGSFGVVFQAKMVPSNNMIAIKKVLQDRRFKNRELQIMRKLKHCNIVALLYFFYSSGDKHEELYLNLVLEYIPETLYKIERQYSRAKQTLPVNYVRLYMYQLFRSLAYVHSLGICHRDIKPQNMLLDSESAILKLCDFGSAKQIVQGEPNVSYICSRYYRAPELIFGSINYTTTIDMWSSGCVLAELLLGQLIFPGDSGVDQIVEIVKVMGTPTAEQLREMNPNYKSIKLPQLKAHPWGKVFRLRTPAEAIDLVSKLLIYTPNARIAPLSACAHPFFDELRAEPHQMLPNGRPMPPLFNFTEYEMTIDPSIMPLLMPKPDRAQRNVAGAEAATGPKHRQTQQHQQQQQQQKQQKHQVATLQQHQVATLQQHQATALQQHQVATLQQHHQQRMQSAPPPPTIAASRNQAPPPPRNRPGRRSSDVNRDCQPNIRALTLQDIGNGDCVNICTPATYNNPLELENNAIGFDNNNLYVDGRTVVEELDDENDIDDDEDDDDEDDENDDISNDCSSSDEA